MNVLARDALQWMQKRWYTLFIALLFILRVFFWFSPSHETKMNITYLWPGVIAAVALVICTRRKWLPQGSALTLGMAAWLLFSCVVSGDPYLEYNRTFLLGIVTCFAACFLAVPMAGPRDYEGTLRLLARVYVGLMVLVAALGIYSVVTATQIRTPFSDDFIGLRGDRLFVFQYQSNEVGSAFVIGFFLALYLAMSGKGALHTLGCILGALVLYGGIAATVSRTAMALAAAGCGVCAFWYGCRALGAKGFWLRWLAALALLLAVTAAAYFSLTQTVGWLSSGMGRTAAIPKAAAEATAPAGEPGSGQEAAMEAEAQDARPSPERSGSAAQARLGIDDLGTFNMRTEIWQAGLTYLKEHPRTLLLGVPDNVVSRIPRSIGRSVFHLHNAFLEMLLLGGIPGLALYLGFLFVLFRHALRLAFAKASPVHHRFLAVIPVLMTLNGVTEIYPLFSGNVMDMMHFVLSGAVIAFSAAIPRNNRGALPQ